MDEEEFSVKNCRTRTMSFKQIAEESKKYRLKIEMPDFNDFKPVQKEMESKFGKVNASFIMNWHYVLDKEKILAEEEKNEL